MNKPLRKLRNRQFFSVFLTAVFGSLGDLISGFVDGVLTGAFLGRDAMAAYGIASPYFVLNTVLSLSFLIASQALCTAEIGRGHEDMAKKIFTFSIWTSLMLSVLVSVFGFLFSEQVAVLFGAGDSIPAVKAETVQYLHWLFPGTVFFSFMTVTFAALQIDGAAGLAQLSAILVGVLDVIGDLLNVFVFHGGLAGMGIATTVSYIGAALVVLPYFLRKKSLFSLDIRLYSLKYAGKIFSASYTETILWTLRMISPIIINRIILAFSGVAALTAMSMQRNLLSLVSIVAFGLGDAAMMVLGLCYGESDRVAAKETVQNIMFWLCIFTVPVTLIMTLFSKPIASLYCDIADAGLFRLSVIAVITLALSVPFTATAKVYLRSLQTMEKNRYAMILSVAQTILLPCGLTLLLCRTAGDTGAFIAYLSAELIAAVIGWLFYEKTMKQPETFPVSEEQIFRSMAETPEQAVITSIKLRDFCRINGCGDSLSYKLSLCMEEMGCGIIQEGLRKNAASKPFVDFIVLFYPDSVIMRIKDNCPDQQLRERALMWRLDSEHPERLIGIRMAMKLSTDFKYIRLLDVNNTTIRFSLYAERK